MSKPLGVILLVDDNPDDYEATYRSMQKNQLNNPVQWCQSGHDAKDYLLGEGKYARLVATADGGSLAAPQPATGLIPPPTLILLDLNLPGMDGRALLRLIKQHDRLRSIPVIVLSTSNDARDVQECYALGASTFIHKPVNFEALNTAIRAMKAYWFGVALLPATAEVHNARA